LRSRKAAFEAGYILLLPVVLFFAYQASPFNQTGFLDPWVYAGFINNFDDLIARYGLTYYSVRFGLIFPNVLLTSLFGPVWSYVVFCYLMYLLAGVPLYFLFRRNYSTAAAIFAYTCLVSSVWFARTVLWTYPDAAAVPYMLAATSLLLLNTGGSPAIYFAVGALFALATNSNIYALSISGLAVSAYVIHRRSILARDTARAISWTSGGFLVILVLGAIGYQVCCGEPNFLQPTLQISSWVASQGAAQYRVDYDLLFHKFHYTYFGPFLVFALFIIWCTSKVKESLYAALAGYACVSTAFVAWWQFVMHGYVLELFYYFSYLLPPFLLAAAAVPVVAVRNLSGASQAYSLMACALVVVLVPLLHVYGVCDLAKMSLQTYLLLATCTLGILVAACKWRILMPVAAVAFAATFQLHWRGDHYDHYAVLGGVHRNEVDAYKLGMQLIKEMPRFKEDQRSLLFWYPNKDPLLSSLQSTYLSGYSRLHDPASSGVGMPALEADDIDRLRRDPIWLVLMDRTAGGTSAGIHALIQNGIIFAKERESQLCSGRLCVHTVLLNLESKAPEFTADKTLIETLIDVKGDARLTQLERYAYGVIHNVKARLAARLPRYVHPPDVLIDKGDGGIFFYPSSVRDHLATRFIDPVSPENGGRPQFRLTLEGLPSNAAQSCRITVQDREFRSVLNVGCKQSNQAGAGAIENVFAVAAMPNKLRVLLQTLDGSAAQIPASIRLEQELYERLSR
jgi:hypothetical protein